MNPNAFRSACGCGGDMTFAGWGINALDALYRCSRCGAGLHVAAQLLGQGLWTPEPEPEPEPPKEPEILPVVKGSVIGYRAWRIREWQLFGTGVNRAWEPGINEATCDAGPSLWAPITSGDGAHKHRAPAIGCHCGITCLARFDEDDQHWANADVFGAIEAWSESTVAAAEPGDVADATGVIPKDQERDDETGFILHGNGFRARYGKVVLLAVDDDWPAAKKAAVRALAREHEADVCKRSHLEDAAKEHGQLVPDDMLKWAAEPLLDPSGGAFIPPLWLQSFQSMGISLNQARAALGAVSISFNTQRLVGGSLVTGAGYSRASKKGIRETLGYNGPPSFGKFKRGDRVKDRAGVVWGCTRGGKPGTWESEE